MKRTLLTFGEHILVFLFNATVPFIVIKSTGIGNIAVTVGALILDFVFIIILNRVMYSIMEYEMNFNICSKDYFTAYSQKGFFRTKTINISTSAIKVVQDLKEGLAGALFEYGIITIHTDGDIDSKGGKTLELRCIPYPKQISKKLNSIIEEKKEALP